ncbi:MAG: HD domain-containing protein [Elusimicrobia bacterium]|nr:HD domain-containing protein [Elusimicrobiota bacterium]
MAKELGMSTSKQQLLQQAALIHDIGFLGLDHPKLIGLNIKDNLNDLARYKLHPIVGSEMIKGIKFMQKLAPIIAVHHRYRNGEGFPENLPIEQISPESEIISILEDYLEKGSIDKIKTERYSESSLQALKNIISR